MSQRRRKMQTGIALVVVVRILQELGVVSDYALDHQRVAADDGASQARRHGYFVPGLRYGLDACADKSSRDEVK